MKVSFIEPAYFELEDAIEYYNQEISGLGEKFYKELLSTITLIKKFPQRLQCLWLKSGFFNEKNY